MPAAPLFPASYDRTTKITSLAIIILLAGVSLAAKMLIVIVPIAAVLLFSYAFSPRGYVIEDENIAVTRLIGTVRIPLAAIREARLATGDDLSGCIRLFGSGGLFGYYGLFRTTRLGKSTWYVTSRPNAVVIVTNRKTIVLSPDDPARFVTAVHRAAPQTETSRDDGRVGASAFESLESEASGGASKIIGIVVGVGALAIAAAAMLYSPGPPGYSLTTNTLAIHDRFYPVTLGADSVDISHVRVVDLSTDAEWRPTMRTGGFANAHYHSGWFRTAGGQKVRMYRADGKRLVLLPGIGDASSVLLETADPDAFVRELQSEWNKG